MDRSHVTVRMPGIGGTGVVTAAQILGVAAGLDGKRIAGLDQTGVSQKAGPVVSELQISDPLGSDSMLLGVDVLLVFDLIVAMSPGNLFGLDPERTMVVGSSSLAPTSAMVMDVDVDAPDTTAMKGEIERRSRPDSLFWIDATEATQALFGERTTVNVFLLGVAHQRGLLPVKAASIEEAIRLNGTSIERNIEAFRWGRCAVADPERLHQQISAPASGTQRFSSGLEAAIADAKFDQRVEGLVRGRVAELLGFQGESIAQPYLRSVHAAWEAESAASPGSTLYTEAVTINLFNVMAYKDEYEVARLLTGPEAVTAAEEVGGSGARVRWMLYPPTLKALGLKKKIAMGAWGRPAMKMLRHGRILRGTRFDPFGYADVRREERALASEYQELCRRVNARLSVIGIEKATRIAAMVDIWSVGTKRSKCAT